MTARAHQEPPRLTPTQYEYRRPGDAFLVATAERVAYIPPNDPVRWKVTVLPEAKTQPAAFLWERMGEVMTKARTPEQAQRALGRIAEAVLAFLDAQRRLETSLEQEITQAASRVGVTEVPLPLDDDQ
jgi:hypothetical protein